MFVDNFHQHSVGATRTIKWKSGEEVQQRLLELSDLHFQIVYENIGGNIPGEGV